MSDRAQADQPASHFCALSVHTEDYPEGTVVYDPETLNLTRGFLYLVAPRTSSSAVQDFQRPASNTANRSVNDTEDGSSSTRKRSGALKKGVRSTAAENHADLSKAMVFVAQPLNKSSEQQQQRKTRGMQVIWSPLCYD